MKNFKEKLQKAKWGLTTLAVGGAPLLLSTNVFAMDTDVKSVLNTKDKNDALNDITTTVSKTGNSLVGIVMIIAVFVLVIMTIIAFLKLSTSNSGNRDDAKGDLMYKVIAAIGVAGTVGLIGVLATIGKNLF